MLLLYICIIFAFCNLQFWEECYNFLVENVAHRFQWFLVSCFESSFTARLIHGGFDTVMARSESLEKVSAYILLSHAIMGGVPHLLKRARSSVKRCCNEVLRVWPIYQIVPQSPFLIIGNFTKLFLSVA